MRIGFSFIIRIIFLIGWAATIPAVADALEYNLGAGVFESVRANQNYWDPDTLRFDRDEVYTVSSGYADLSISPGGNITAFLSGTADWIHDFEPESEDDLDVRLLGAYLGYTGENLSADLGRKRFVFGPGLILDDDETGATFLWSPGKSHYVEIKAARAIESSPLASLTAGYRPGFLEKIELFGAWMQDRDDGFADLLNRQAALDIFSGDGDLGWLGVSADLFISDLYVSGIGMWQTGRLTVTHPQGENDRDLSAWLFDAACSYNLTSAFSTAIFLFAASGDRHPAGGDIHAFVSPMPYNPRADIFFSGGLDGSDITEGFSLAGVRWPGVIAPGVELSWQPRPEWLAILTGVILFPEDGPGGDRTPYGWETDLTIARTWGDFNEVFVGLGLFMPGELLESPAGERPDPILGGTAGISLFF